MIKEASYNLLKNGLNAIFLKSKPHNVESFCPIVALEGIKLISPLLDNIPPE